MSSPERKIKEVSGTLLLAFLLSLLICIVGIIYVLAHPYKRVDRTNSNVSAPNFVGDGESSEQKIADKSPQITEEAFQNNPNSRTNFNPNSKSLVYSKSTRVKIRQLRQSKLGSKRPQVKIKGQSESPASLNPKDSSDPPLAITVEDKKNPTPSPSLPQPEATLTDQPLTPEASLPKATSTPTSSSSGKGTIVEIPPALPEEHKPNPVKRFFSWFTNLFKKRPSSGQVFIITSPSGFPLLIDGEVKGLTSVSNANARVTPLELPAGKHQVEIIFPNDQHWSTAIEVVTGRKYHFSLEYRPETISKSPCPYQVSVSAPATVNDGDMITFSSEVQYDGASAINYTWTVSPVSARIVSGVGTPTITIDSTGLGVQHIAVTLLVDDGSGKSTCHQTAQASVNVVGAASPSRQPIKFDEFRTIRVFDDERARLDNLAIRLQDEPTARAYVIAYGSYVGEGQGFADRSVTYLISRGIDSERLSTIGNVCRDTPTIELWVVPLGAPPPQPSQTIPCEEKRRIHPLSRPPRRRPPPNNNGSNEPGEVATSLPSPTPSPSASPSPSPTPPAANEEKDRITINYPLTLCFRHAETIRVVYDRGKGEFKPEVRKEADEVTVPILTDTTKGIRKSERLPEGVQIAKTTAEPELIGEGFEFTPLERNMEKSLDEDRQVWEWQITPKGLYRDKQPINLKISVHFYDKNDRLIKTNEEWVREKIYVDVSILTNGEIGAFSGFFGVTALALLGFGWKMMALLPTLFMRKSIYKIYGGQQGAVGDGAQAIGFNQESKQPKKNSEGEQNDGRSEEG